MRVIFLIFLFSISSTGFSQCEVSKSKEDNGDMLYESGVERLFGDGPISVSIYSAISVSANDVNKVKYMLVVMCAVPAGTHFVPRKMIINLDNGSSVPLVAEEKLPSSFSNNREYESCIFRISLVAIDLIQSYTIKSVEIIDHYASKTVKGVPYNELLKDQFTCLLKSIRYLWL